MVLLCVFLLSSLLVKKSFCSWLCPVGTVSEYLWKLGRKFFRRSFTVPRWLDLRCAASSIFCWLSFSSSFSP